MEKKEEIHKREGKPLDSVAPPLSSTEVERSETEWRGNVRPHSRRASIAQESPSAEESPDRQHSVKMLLLVSCKPNFLFSDSAERVLVYGHTHSTPSVHIYFTTTARLHMTRKVVYAWPYFMKNLPIWFYVVAAVSIALIGNSVSAIWAKGDDKTSLWLLALILVSPMVFLSFGFVTSKLGLAVTSGVIDSLLTVSTMAVGIFFFQEWQKISFLQYFGMALALLGIFLMIFFPKTGT